MSVAALASLILLNLVGAAAPGPDILLILRTATRSRRHAYAAVFGIGTGLIVWNVLTVAGAAVLLGKYPGIIHAVEGLGGSFLLYMGYRMASGAWRDRQAAVPRTLEETLGTPGHVYRLGALTNLSNPKAVLFFAAIVAPLLPAHPSVMEAGIVVVALWVPAMLLFLLVSTVVSTQAIRSRLLGIAVWIDLGAGLFFMAVGASLVGKAGFALLG